MTDQSPGMWDYWRDKKGRVEALRDYYPELVAQTPELQMALFQIQSAEAMIDKIMLQRAEEEPDE